MELFLSPFVTLLVIIDPLGTAAVYAALTAGAMNDEARGMARKATLVATGILLLFGLFGAVLIKQLGISLEAFRIAGGLLLFVIAFRMLMGHHDQNNIESKNSVYSTGAARGDIAIFPIAIPLLAGPGCMTAMILLTNQAPDTAGKAVVYAAMLTVMVIAYVSMRAAQRIIRVFGAGGIQIIARLMGILLAALAVQFIADGVRGLSALV
jgi:multiple antibiotic resistance protein